MMKADFDLDGDIKLPEPYESTRDEIFQRLFGSERKLGMHNDVVRMILTNEKLYNTILSQDFLLDVITQLDIQTRSDINTNIVSKFENLSIKEIKASAFSEDGKKKQSFKLPWCRLHNIEALIIYLEKLQYRANKEENLEREYNHITKLIAYFNGLVRNSVHVN